ncbi:alpha/beta fold hydrolase [Reinekea sp. G2M2-21]|uniref:alpha/beta fold hydrolase n=1 Tax=Reinekea sp. G2M2-21 TaxID=2788942 RepID=UPI0018A9A2AC|nr:alpha/beta hydrolase [Reinekea sp. G2M2-21]
MKTNQFVLSIVILIAVAAGSLAQASEAQLTAIDHCKSKPKHALCYDATLAESANSDRPVTIRVQHWPASGERLNPYPIVWLMGGPGMSNLNPPLPDWVWEHFDVLTIGYRGIDGTPRLDCPTLRKQFKLEGKNNKEDFLAQTTLDRLTAEVRVCQQQWEADGVDTQAYGIYEVVEDIDQVRKALGLAKINLLSVSYGTRIAWYFDQLKPGVVDRNLIMSANPDGGFFFDPTYTDAQLTVLEQQCNADTDCAQNLPNLKSTMADVLANLPEKAWGAHLDADQIRLITFMMLYSRNSMPMVIDAYSKAAQGNYSGLVAMQKFPNPFKSEDWVWGTFFSAGAIDLNGLGEVEQTLARTADSTVLNAPLSELLYNGITKGWQARAYGPLANRPTQTPTLILGSDVDVATPVERIEQFWMPYVTNGALIKVAGAGHAPDHILAGGPALEAHLMHFLATGEATTDQQFGTPFDFKPGFSLSWVTYGFWSLVAGISAGLIVTAFVLL